MRALAFAFLVLTLVAAQTPKERAQQLLAKMSQDQKLAMVHGYGGSYVGNVNAISALGIPALHLEDGPQGVADGVTQVTAFPSALTVVASWDVEAMKQFGQAMGQEQLGKGTNVLLGPMINLARVPQGGRNFESFGEDPYLASVLVRAQVAAIQSTGVMACAKHYVDNSQENDRTGISEDVNQRTQYELYYPHFKAAVEAGVWSFMCSYNKINSTWACENPTTLAALHNYMGFEGFIMSDWGATHTTVASANAGLDMEMPGSDYFGSALSTAIQNGQVPQSRLDDMVTRILTSMYGVGLMDRPATGNISANVRSDAHDTLARTLAEAGTVLLKNQGGILPLMESQLKTIAVIGDDGAAKPTATGGGSGNVQLPYLINPLGGIQTRVGYGKRPVNCTYEQDIDYYQPGNPSAKGSSADECCSICTNTVGCNYFTFQSPDTCWLKPTNAGRQSSPGLVSGACAQAPPGDVNVTYTDSADTNAAAAAAKAADVAIVFVATDSSEGSDRPNLSLSGNSDALVSAVIAAQPKTIVVVHSPGAVLMPWRDSVPAIIAAFLPGQEDGNAIASILFGDVNPSGRLPLSFPNTDKDTWLTTTQQYPGTNGHAVYSEELKMGYRWYSSQGTKPLFGFGFGLSYTTFQYSSLSVSGDAASNFSVSFTVTNNGKVAGQEVPQLYVTFPDSAGEPPEQLKGFTKTALLQPAQNVKVTFVVTQADLSIWDVTQGKWAPVKGQFTLNVGTAWSVYSLKGTLTV